MKRLIEFPLSGGGSMVVEVDDVRSPGQERAGRLGDAATKAQETFEAAISKIKPAAAAILDVIRDLADPPQEAKVQFGIKFSAEAGAVLASATLEANYVVTLTWQADKAQTGSRPASPE